MEETNQGSPIKRKSDRPTMFITVLNATEEELYQAHKVLEDAGVGEDYRVMLSSKVIQAASESELLAALSDVDASKNIERMAKMQQAIYHIAKAVDGLTQAGGAVNQNIEYLTNAHNNKQEYVHTAHALGLVNAKNAIHTAQQFIPKEGEEW